MAEQQPRFAVWPYLNQYCGRREVPRSKCHDGRESWELPPPEVTESQWAGRVAERGRPFRTEEQVLEWRRGVVVEAEPEQVPIYVGGTREALCRLYSLTAEEFERQFMPTSEPNVYQSGWRPGRTDAVLRGTYCPYYGPVVYLREADGPTSSCTLRGYWRFEDIDTPRFDVRYRIKREFDNANRGITNDPQCSLGNDWDFDRIEQMANRMQGHQFEGLRFQSYQHRIAAAAYDLDDALSAVHPGVSASARASFWSSHEVHRHLCEHVRRLIEYADTLPANAKTGLDNPKDAFLCAQTQVVAFARAVVQTRYRPESAAAVALDERAVIERPGRKPNVALNQAIGKIVVRFGPEWRCRLAEICEILDEQEIPLPRSPKWKRLGCSTWVDVLAEDADGLTKALRYRLHGQPAHNAHPESRG